MKFCESGVVEVFYRFDGEPVMLYPRFCVDQSELTALMAPCLKEGISLQKQLKRKPDSVVCFRRTYGLGDIVLLTPIFNWFKEEYPFCQIYLVTDRKFLELFRYWDVVMTVCDHNISSIGYDVGYYLDDIVEKDHVGSEDSYKHRLDLYCEFLGIPALKEPVFFLPYGENEKNWAEEVVGVLRKIGKPIVVMQAFGSREVKRFSFGKVVKIVEELVKICSLILVHDTRVDFERVGMINLTGVTSVHELVALVDSVDAVVTMDSSVLWIAHCTQTPIIALLGPTREQERLKYHRNYIVVNLAKMVGCEPCFERMVKCGGMISCMEKSNDNQIVKEIASGIKRFVS